MSWLRSIRVRVVAAFAVAALAMLGAMGFLVGQVQTVSERHALITEGYLPIAQDVDALAVHQERVDDDVARLVAQARRPGVGADSSTAIYSDALHRDLQEARIHAETAKALAADPKDQAAVRKILAQLGVVEAQFQAWQTQSAAVVELLEQGEVEQAKAGLEPLKLAAARMGDEITTLATTVKGRITGLAAEADALRVRANLIAGLLAALATLLSGAGITAVLLALRPIGQLTDQVQRLAAGDYSGGVIVQGADEVAVLAGEFNAMVEALRLRDRTLVERAQQLDVLTRYLSSVLDSLEDGLLAAEEGRITLANPAACRVWSVDRGDPVPLALAPLVDRPGLHELRGEDGARYELRVTRFGDRGAIVVSADVTEQHDARERLARSERLALIGQMLAQITHEVRNPLNALSLNAELLGDELTALDPEKRTEAWAVLGTVSGEIDRLTQVTAHYLAMARRPRARLEPVELGVLVDDVVRLLHAELGQQGVALEVDCEAVPSQFADGNQLRQAILNVVRNATEAGATHLKLALIADADAVRVRLTDDGPGMRPEELDRATDPFFSTKATGTGLGLAITRQILEDHGGSLQIASRPGEGCTVELVLPARPVDRGATLPAEAP